jgi:hypothetical protein
MFVKNELAVHLNFYLVVIASFVIVLYCVNFDMQINAKA